MRPRVDSRPFGTLSNGAPVTEFTLDNGNGMRLQVLDYGCIIRSWTLDIGDAAPLSIVLGFDSLQEYERDTAYFGAVVGRFANRIGQGRFELDGTSFQLSRNEGGNHLHGGVAGFHKQLWRTSAACNEDAARLNLYRLSPAGEEGYPGDLLVMVSYEVERGGQLRCHYQALSDQATPVSISQHSYFNLAGKGDILGHLLCVDAEHYLPVRADLVPTGVAQAVAGSPFDFRLARRIGSGLCADDPQIALAAGYDHNFVLAGIPGPHASLIDPVSKRRLEIYTDCPGLQFYSGNYLDGSLSGHGRAFERYAGLCLEPQQFPDAPNQPSFPKLVCRPGAPCSMATLYALSNWR